MYENGKSDDEHFQDDDEDDEEVEEGDIFDLDECIVGHVVVVILLYPPRRGCRLLPRPSRRRIRPHTVRRQGATRIAATDTTATTAATTTTTTTRLGLGKDSRRRWNFDTTRADFSVGYAEAISKDGGGKDEGGEDDDEGGIDEHDDIDDCGVARIDITSIRVGVEVAISRGRGRGELTEALG